MTDLAAKRRIGVIGAGLTGLTAAYQLLKSGLDVVMLESTLQPGGMVASFQFDLEPIEYIYHHIFTSDRHLTELVDELGLGGKLTWHNSREALYAGERLYPFSSPLDLLRFNPIPLTQRIRTGLTVLGAARVDDWRQLESQTASDWLCRKGGRRAYKKLWKPLLYSKFEDDAENVSAVWIWNKFKLRGHSREKGSGKPKLGYMTGGFGTLISALKDKIIGMGGQIHFGHTVTDVRRHPDLNGRYLISCVLGNCESADFTVDGVVATIAGRQFANIAGELNLPERYMKQVRSLRYKGDLCMVLRLRKSLSPYYWTTVCDHMPFVVAIEHTRLTGTERYGGHIIYLSRYLDAASPLWTQPDSEIYRLFTRGLAQMYPAFSPEDIIDWRLRRTRYAQPVIGCGYSCQMPSLDTPLPGIKLAGMAQIYPEDRGMNYAVRLGNQAAEAIVRDFRRG